MPTAATVYISESNGVGESVTDNISNINFGSVDTPNIVSASHPIVIGESSFFKMLRFKVQSLGDSTTIKDLRLWKSAGTYLTGEFIKVVDNAAGFNYVQPSQITTPNPPFNAVANIRTADPGSAIIAIAGATGNNFPDDEAVPGYSDYTVMQTVSSALTPSGAGNTKTILFQYDET